MSNTNESKGYIDREDFDDFIRRHGITPQQVGPNVGYAAVKVSGPEEAEKLIQELAALGGVMRVSEGSEGKVVAVSVPKESRVTADTSTRSTAPATPVQYKLLRTLEYVGTAEFIQRQLDNNYLRGEGSVRNSLDGTIREVATTGPLTEPLNVVRKRHADDYAASDAYREEIVALAIERLTDITCGHGECQLAAINEAREILQRAR